MVSGSRYDVATKRDDANDARRHVRHATSIWCACEYSTLLLASIFIFICVAEWVKSSACSHVQNQNFYPGGLFGAGGPMQPMAPAGGQPQTEVCSVSVPNSAVGALIGSGGVNIKQIIRESGAYVAVSHFKEKILVVCKKKYSKTGKTMRIVTYFQIEPKKEDDSNPGGERTVSVKGSPEAIWKVDVKLFTCAQVEVFIRLRVRETCCLMG